MHSYYTYMEISGTTYCFMSILKGSTYLILALDDEAIDSSKSRWAALMAIAENVQVLKAIPGVS